MDICTVATGRSRRDGNSGSLVFALVSLVFLSLGQLSTDTIDGSDPVFHLVRRGGLDQECTLGSNDPEGKRVLLDCHWRDGMNRFELDDSF